MLHRFMSWCWLNIGLSSTFAKLLKSFCYCLASYFYFFLLKFMNNHTDALAFEESEITLIFTYSGVWPMFRRLERHCI